MMAWGKWLATIISLPFCWLAMRTRRIRPAGALALALATVMSIWFGDWSWGLVMVVFWLTALLLTGYRTTVKRQLGDRFSFSARRGWIQVVAWCGWPVILALLNWLQPGKTVLYAGYVGALAAAAADTWATELGVLNLQSPKMITSGRRVPPGTAGAVSPLGLVASVAGAWFIGLIGLGAQVLLGALSDQAIWNKMLVWLPLAAAFGGVVGALLDSFFGATAQALYYCEHCECYSEERLHSCGREAHQVRGWAWLTNDGVNLIASLVGAAVTAGLIAGLARSMLQW